MQDKVWRDVEDKLKHKNALLQYDFINFVISEKMIVKWLEKWFKL